MRLAMVFPGQGSQSLNMLRDVWHRQEVISTLKLADEALNADPVWDTELNISQLIANGSLETLSLTVYTQPIILAVSIALYRVWLADGGVIPSIMAGHSLGEYTALVASEVLDFADALRLVSFRAKVMQEAVPIGFGAMAAIIGLDKQVVCNICVEVTKARATKPNSNNTDLVYLVEAVNFNAAQQTVISGSCAEVNLACELAKTAGAKIAVLLPVSAPFHSSLMKPASEKLQEYLGKVNLKPPKIPVINNVDVMCETLDFKIKDALTRQASMPVRWLETIEAMVVTGVTDIIECGPGKILQTLNKRIAPTLKHTQLNLQPF